MISELAGLQQVTAFTFLLTFFGMAAAALFLLIERSHVEQRFQLSVSVAGLICAIAAANYFFMQRIYLDGAASGGSAFPTEFRYIDWFLTVPLMLAQFPMHLGLGRRGRGFMVRLIGLSLVMLTLGYIGEVNPDRPGLQLLAWGLGCLAGLGIFLPLSLALRHLPDRVPESSLRTVRAMALLTIIGWLVYPIGYLQPLLGFPPDVRELVYNVADLVNKVGLGLIIFLGGRYALSGGHAVRRAVSDSDNGEVRSATESLLARRS